MLVVGSLALDTVETPFGKVENSLGGSATFISIAASYFTAPIKLVGVVGGDFPKEHISLLEEHSVDLEGLQIIEEGKTFRWAGKYHYDLNVRDTIYTHLNVFEKFDPIIPEKYKRTKYVCLGNIDPTLQRKVLQQIEKPKLVLCDTMNFWIEGKNEELKETLKLVDVLVLNDSEARLLAKEPNLIKAAKTIISLGPRCVIIKKGEHGALMVTENTIFSAPAYPIENINDPTGAGDTFAGGFIGWIARTDDTSDENIKKAVIYGSTMASFCVEKFSIEGLLSLSYLKIQDRFREFISLSKIEE
ncbi:MAG TPA: PfkB family carbohydrate kinase [Bacteroidota bacterium]|nr:PfkB family carbohydrate kinase [Bacteroidota bacterium]